MSTDHIAKSVDRTLATLNDHPDQGRGTISAKAIQEDRLRIRAEQAGEHVITTDMSSGVGGDGSGPSPGTIARAALASCDATMVAIRAAQKGIDLTTLEVVVDWDYDSRGMLGVDDAIPAGPLAIRVQYRIAGDRVSTDQLETVAEWAEAHSPVGDAFRRAVTYENDIEIV